MALLTRVPGSPRTFRSEVMPTEAQIRTAIALLKENRKEHTTDLLRNHKIKISGNWSEIEDRLTTALREKRISLADVAAVVDVAEESGRQHIFLFTCPLPYLTKLKDVKEFEKRTKDAALHDRFNSPTRLVDCPADPVCVAVLHDGKRIKIKWVETREVPRIDPAGTVSRNGIVVQRKWVIKKERGIVVLNLDLDSGACDLRVSVLPRGGAHRYEDKFQEYEPLFPPLVDLGQLTPLTLEKVSAGIKKRKEYRLNLSDGTTTGGSRVMWVGGGEDAELRDDPKFAAAEPDDVRVVAVFLTRMGTPGKADNKDEMAALKRPLRVLFHCDRNEVEIPGQCDEAQVMHVLSTARSIAGA